MTRRLLLTYLTLTAFVLVVLEIPLGLSFARSQRAQLAAAVERDATVLASFAEDQLEAGTATGLAALARAYHERTGGRVVIVDRTGLSLADSDPPAPGTRDFSSRPEIAAALRGDVATGDRFSTTLDSGLLYVAVPVASGGQVHGALRVSYPTAAVDSRVRRNWLLLGLVGVVVLAAAALVGLTLARSVTRPLVGLERAAEKLERGRLTARAPTDSGPPELRRLAHRFNAMASRLEELLGSQQAFVADASHQLRTPLTALRLRLENLEGALDRPEDAEELEAALDELARLAMLVEGLLALARAEGTESSLQPVDVAGALRDRLAAWTPLAAEQHVRLDLETNDPVRAMAVPGALEQIVDNYLGNALRAAPAGSTIRLATARDGDWVGVHVIDAGPGMSADQARRAFDRFWRASPGDGFGLGLSIVQRLATACGGEAELRPAGSGGVDAVLLLRPDGRG
jgi:signal transduction histidine kinase